MDGGGGGGGQEGQPPNQGGLSLAQQVQMARAYFKAGDLGAALTILRGSLLDSAADNSRENLKAKAHALFLLGHIYAALGDDDTAGYYYHLSTRPCNDLVSLAQENVRLCASRLSVGGSRLCSLFNDTARQEAVVDAFWKSWAALEHKETRRPHVVVAGPTSCILAVSLAKAGAMVTIVEDLQLLTVLGKKTIEGSGLTRPDDVVYMNTEGFINSLLPSQQSQEEVSSASAVGPVDGLILDLFPYNLEPGVFQLVAALQDHPSRSSHPLITIPSRITIRAMVVESIRLRQLSHVNPEDNGVIQGLQVGAVLDALGRQSVPIDLPVLPYQPLHPLTSLLQWELGLTDMAALGRGVVLNKDLEVAANRNGHLDSIVYWLEMDSGTPHGALLSCTPPLKDDEGGLEALKATPLSGGHRWQIAWLDFENRVSVKEGQVVKVKATVGRGSGDGVGEDGGKVPAVKWEMICPRSSSVVDTSQPPILDYHLPMVNDACRNLAYEKALIEAINYKKRDGSTSSSTSGIHVLDIGSGSGLLGMLAARAGASQVSCCEKEALLAGASALISQDNGYDDIITVFHEKSTDLTAGDIGGHASILISEIFGDQPLSESVLPTFAHAQCELLEPSAIIIPSRICIMAALAHITDLSSLTCCPAPVTHYDCLVENPVSLYLANHPHNLLTPPTCVGEIDLGKSPIHPQGQLQAILTTLPIIPDQPNAVVSWFELVMLPDHLMPCDDDDCDQGADGATGGSASPEKHHDSSGSSTTGGGKISTGPQQGLMPHWKQCVWYLPPSPSPLQPNEGVKLVANYSVDRLTWQVYRGLCHTTSCNEDAPPPGAAGELDSKTKK